MNWKEQARGIFRPLGRRLAERGVEPDHLTIAGVVLSLIAALLLGRGAFFASGLVLLLAGIFDILDGDVARERGIQSKFGAFLDSTLDRVSEGALYIGLAYFYFTRSQSATVWMRGMFEGSAEWGDADGPTLGILALATLVLSFLVSYTRARAEGLGMDCKVGVMERPERLLALGAGALLGHRFMPGVLGVVFILTLVTVLQRVYHVRKLTQTNSA
ncbi:MAG TPA: CDP-alcohol phosphatidyltransferase family protein [Candidatus Limnocylindrales bacterium]|nr:CDP-alcohol phosphatidyltransferase family protein [Candidatus Limnocylindrales bacterium]